jgi:hypothetical protein
MGIHSEILTKIETVLQAAMIDDLVEADATRAGVVMIGPLQGNPDPLEARISVTIHENDPDHFYGLGDTTGIDKDWHDQIYDEEIGGVKTYERRFTVKARCLLESTSEGIVETREIASSIRSRLEDTLQDISFAGIVYNGERVTRGVSSIHSEMVQAGGPPSSYDFHIKVRFDVLTTTGV